MGLIFKDDFHDEFGTWPIGYIPYGGADFGEILAVAQAVGGGDDAAFYDAWTAAGDGAGDHCEMANRSRLNRSVLDWLDGVLGCGPR
jgi:hypothetical protein